MFMSRSLKGQTADSPSLATIQANDEQSKCVQVSEQLLRLADDFRSWVVRDLQALGDVERADFRGDYLFIIDEKPMFLVIVSPTVVSSARCDFLDFNNLSQGLVADMGAPLELTSQELESLFAGQVRVLVRTQSHTLRRLLEGTMKAKVAYLNGLVKMSGDLPCFMRLVALLKGRGIGPRPSTQRR